MKNAKKKSAVAGTTGALAEVFSGLLAAALLLGTAGWWMLDNCRKADRLVYEYGQKLKAEQNAAAELENFLNSK